MGSQLEAEDRVGRVTVRTGTRPEVADYRRPALTAALEIERGPLPFTLTRGQGVVIGLGFVLSAALFAFTLFATSSPVVCLAPLVMVACVGVVGYQRNRRVLLRVGADAITVSRSLSSERIALEHVEGLGVGLDAPYSTVWITVRTRGRVLLLDGLTRDEADLVSRRLRTVLAPSS